jgi:hypothetical protein
MNQKLGGRLLKESGKEISGKNRKPKCRKNLMEGEFT